MSDRESVLVDIAYAIVDWIVEHTESEESPLSNEMTDRPKEGDKERWR